MQAAEPITDHSRKWPTMAAVGVGVLLATIDGSIVNIALPTIRQFFGTSLAVVQWVSVGYLLTLASLTLGVGRWGDVVGKKKIYTVGFVIFTVASVACGLAPSIAWLIAFRVVQALGAVMILALGAAIVTEAFPDNERGKALGLIGTFVSIGVVTGPVLGGLLIDALDWRAIFFVNLPVGVIGTYLAFRNVPDLPPVGRQRFDWLGAMLLSATLLAGALAVTMGQEVGYGSAWIIGLAMSSTALLFMFVRFEIGHDQPMIDLRLFRDPLLTVSIVTGFLVFVAIAAVFFLLPFFLEGVLRWEPSRVGLALGVAPLVLGVVSPIAGSWSDRVGVRKLTLLGLSVMALGFLGYLLLTAQTSFATFALLSIPIGAGIGLFQSPNNSAIMGSVPRAYQGVAGGILTLTRLLGQIAGVAVLGSVWAARVSARAGPLLEGDATTARATFQAGGFRDTVMVMITLLVVAAIIGYQGLRRSRAV